MNSGEEWSEETAEQAEEAIGYRFRDKELLKTCFTHTSYANLGGGGHNERLEFLGDAVLELCVSEELFHRSGGDEGKLTELRKQYVSRSALECAEKRAGLMRFLRYSGGKSNVSGKTPSNLFEAVVAGIYLDGGMGEVKKFLSRFLAETQTENYKSLLQELVQKRPNSFPEYRVKEQDGKFVCTVSALGQSAKGEGESKKAAETAAAQALYHKLRKRNIQ